MDLVLWVMGAGFTIMCAGFTVSFYLQILLYKEIKELKTQIHDIDKRLYGVETLLHMKDCCILKSDQGMKKAE